MATTTHLGVTLLEAAQAQKEITVNEGFARIDAVLNCGAIDKDVATPPASPATGDVYIVAASPTGAWASKANQIAFYDQIWRFVVPNEGMLLWVRDEDMFYVFNGASWQILTTTIVNTSPVALAAEGRLTLTSNQPVTTADVTAATSVFYTPYVGNNIALYNTTLGVWQALTFAQLTIAVPAVANANYDVFLYNNGGVVAAETVAWSSATARAIALAVQHGVWVKAGDASRRYVGSFRTTSVAGQVEDSRERRFVWNAHNRVMRHLLRTESTASWVYSTATTRQVNNSSANQLVVLVGLIEDTLTISVNANVTSSTATPRGVSSGIGVNSTTAYVAAPGSYQIIYTASGQVPFVLTTMVAMPPSIGLTTYSWLERGAGADTQTWYGGGALGIYGSMQG